MSPEPGPTNTSERICAGNLDAQGNQYRIWLFHLATYDFARRFVAGRRVLDFGCGTGYGDQRIAGECASITGVDVSETTIGYAKSAHGAANVDYHVIDPVERGPLPFADASFDVVLSFQVIEHVPDAHRYVDEAWRVLTDDGVFVVATPDRRSRLLPGQRPWNRYHVHEYTSDGLAHVLGRRFPVVESYGMGGPAELIRPEIARARRTSYLTLPFTFPGAPEGWRQRGLAALDAAMTRMRERGAATAPTSDPGSDALGDAPPEMTHAAGFPHDESSVRIAPGVQPSVNLVMVARKGLRGDASA